MTIKKEQQSVLAIVAGLFILAWLKHNYYLLVAGVIILLSFPFPILYKPTHRGWMLLSNILGWISRHIILLVLFYLFLTPISLLMKLFGASSMFIRLKKENSTFSERKHDYSKEDFKNPW